MLKKLLALLLALTMCLSLGACEDDYEGEYEEDEEYEDYEDYEDDEEENSGEIGFSGDSDQTWAIYWYLCCSDLESEYGAATDDLSEMMEVTLPDNVTMVVQTGGAWMWMNEVVDPDYTERYVYRGDELELVDQQPKANMGEASTYADFLDFCSTNYPADRTAVIMWNHGGGSVTGVSFDENYDYDSLTLSEMHQAFDAVYELSPEDPPIDVIGFDTCLMATIDSAAAFRDVAEIMVASEEMEPGIGWHYTGWLQALADDPGMDGARLGMHICDTYLSECRWNLMGAETTLSVVDLQKVDPLLDAYEEMGAEALEYALVDPGFFSDFCFEAEFSENYGGNTRDQGYSNMVDLGDLARNCQEILPVSAQKVLDALEDCVLYEVNGLYRLFASGLSCYHSFNGDLDDLYGFTQEGYSDSFKYLYTYALGGDIDQDAMDYIESIGYEEETLPEVPNLEQAEDQDYPLYIEDEDYVVLELDQDTLNMLKGVYFELAYVDEEEDLMLLLGRDNDIQADWDTGIFRDNFRGVWGCLDGCLCYMEVYYEGEDYTAYSVPILLNGEEYSLRVIYDYNDEEFYILGARKGLDETGMADKNLIQLKPGDEITTIHYASSLSGDDDFQQVPVDTFTVTEDTAFTEEDLGDGSFLMMFELVDARNNEAYSEAVLFTVTGDEYEIEILE